MKEKTVDERRSHNSFFLNQVAFVFVSAGTRKGGYTPCISRNNKCIMGPVGTSGRKSEKTFITICLNVTRSGKIVVHFEKKIF